LRVYFKHHVLTQNVFTWNTMKTVGERIRQAREYRKMSGEELAQKVGYKHQSGISNLENRATGRGGFNIQKIAEALDVSIEWLINGPDTIDAGTVKPFRDGHQHGKQAAPRIEVEAEKSAELMTYDWPFRTVKKADWYSIPQATRDIIEMQVKSLIPTDTENKKAA
jgi:transcriptional regulator with XRE-family HTH domain